MLLNINININNKQHRTMMKCQEDIGLIEKTMMDFIRENFDYCEEKVKKIEDVDPYIPSNYWNWSEEDHRYMIISDVLEKIFEDKLFIEYILKHTGFSQDVMDGDYYLIINMIILYKTLKREKMVRLLPGLLGDRVDANIATIIYDYCV